MVHNFFFEAFNFKIYTVATLKIKLTPISKYDLPTVFIIIVPGNYPFYNRCGTVLFYFVYIMVSVTTLKIILAQQCRRKAKERDEEGKKKVSLEKEGKSLSSSLF